MDMGKETSFRNTTVLKPTVMTNVQTLYEFCSCSEEDTIDKLSSSWKGLNTNEADLRIKTVGQNILAATKKQHFLMDIFQRTKNPLVIQLLVICSVSFLLGDLRSVLVVGGMIFLGVFLGYFQERQSSKAAEKLQQMVQASSVVLRDGTESNLPIREIVPGDIVLLAAGSIVPADARILFAKDFFVSQSVLTGESMPVEKFSTAKTINQRDPLSFNNACFQGSTVISGTAKTVVVNTGLNTFLGTISKDLTDPKENTNFDKGVKSFVWLMVRFMVVMVSLTFLIVGITKHDWLQAVLFSLSVAVGLTPEMLPMIMTVCLSKGAIAMSKKKVIVKKLKAIQNFGSMTVLCTDKTGTLTQDRIILERHVDVTNRRSDDVLRYAYMNSYYQTGLRNLLDKAILNHENLDVEKSCRKVDEIPFDFNRKRMSVAIDDKESVVLICKGAVEDVYKICNQYQVDDEIYPMIEMIQHDLLEEYQELSQDGYRVLAVAYKEFDRSKEVFSATDESDMILLGYVAFLDPPKDSSAKAIRALKHSGVDIKILTGDNELVTQKICKDVGIEIEQLITGEQLEGLGDEAFRIVVKETNIFAKLTPLQKEKIIQTLKAMDEVVGFLGDGINDAPAMKAADVGISVDTAVDVAKESADIILLEKSLAVLEDGILEGRKIFANIIKYIKMGSSSNLGNMFSVVGGSYFLPFLPMTPVQVLTNNLLYDISQTGIPTDHVDEEFVKRPPKWDMTYIRKFMMFIGPISSIFDYATFFLMLYFFKCILFTETHADPSMKMHYENLFHTGWFVESLLTQTLIVHIIRTKRIPFFQSRSSMPLALCTLGIMATAILLPYSPLASTLGLVPLPAVYWVWIAGFLLAYGTLTHFVKTWFHGRIEGLQ